MPKIVLSKYTKKAFSELEKRGWSKDRIAQTISVSPALEIDKKFSFLKPEIRNALKKFQGVQKDVIIGFLSGIEEEPEKIILVATLSMLAPTVIAGMGGRLAAIKIIKPMLKRVPASVKAKGGKAVSAFLTTAYLGTTGLVVAATPEGERAKKVGRLLSTEVTPFSVGTRLGVRGYLRTQIKNELKNELKRIPAEKRNAFQDYMKQAEVFGKYEPRVSNIKLNNIESIQDKNAQFIIRKYLISNKDRVVVGGSVAQTGQIKVKRKLGDMDLYVEKGLNPTQAAKNLANQLKRNGIKRVSQIRGQVTINGKKAIEFHDILRLKTNIKEVIPIWQRAEKYIIKTPEGIRIQRIGMQARRKLVAAFVDPKRLATGKYKKDLKDFKLIADRIFRNAERKARKSFFFKDKKTKEIEKIFGKKVKAKKIKAKKVKVKKIKVKVKKIKIKRIKIKRIKIKKIKVKKIKIKRIKIERIKVKKIKIKRIKAEKIKKVKKKIKPSQRRIRKKKIVKYPPIKIPKKPTKYPPVRPPKRPTKYPPVKIPKKPTKYPPVKIPKRPTKYPPVKIPKKPTKYPPVKIPKRPPVIIPPKKPPIIPIIPKGFTKRKLSKTQNVFYVVEKVKGRFRKLYPKKLTKGHATDYAVHSIDNRLSKTAFLIPMGSAKLISQPPKSIQGYYNRNSHKVRKYKIKFGKKRQMVNGFIEKRKFAFDRPMERSQSLKLRLLARRKVKSKTPFRRVVKKRTLVRKPQSKKIVRRVVKRRKPVRRKKKR